MRLSKRELNQILKQQKINDKELTEDEEKKIIKKEKNAKALQVRLEKACVLLNSIEREDKIFLTPENDKCLLIIKDIDLLSNNACLRLGARQLKTYKKLWHERIDNLITKDVKNRWGDNNKKPIKIEFIYETFHNHSMDYDGRIAAIKSPLDGLVESKLLKDDSEKYVPIILGRQRASNDKKNNLYLILSVEEDPDKFYSDEFLNLWKK